MKVQKSCEKFWWIQNYFVTLRRELKFGSKMKQTNNHGTAEVLTFRKGDLVATIATNGKRHVSQVGTRALEHGSLNMAISYLECMGYHIDTSGGYQV